MGAGRYIEIEPGQAVCLEINIRLTIKAMLSPYVAFVHIEATWPNSDVHHMHTESLVRCTEYQQ